MQIEGVCLDLSEILDSGCVLVLSAHKKNDYTKQSERYRRDKDMRKREDSRRQRAVTDGDGCPATARPFTHIRHVL